jgi:hypothetical protein
MRTPRLLLIGVFVLALAVRLVWLLHVQHPLDAVYSDMGGYVDRADGLLAHKTPSEPRVLTIYPWGAHALLALEFLVLGRHARVALAIAAAFVGAVPAPCMAALSARLVPSRPVAAMVGVLVALWPPQVAFTGFFLSEIWFAAAIAGQAALTVQPWRRPWGRLGVGLVSAIAFVVRPQFLLTWVVDMASWAFALLRRGGVGPGVRALCWLALPMAIAIGFSAVRLHRLAGHWGLISENDQMTRIWAETEICQLRASWTTPNGQRWNYWFNPPSKPAQKPSDIVQFEGYIADPNILGRIREERLRGVPWTARLARKLRNVGLLYTGNLPWPESNYREPTWRLTLQKISATALLFVVAPLSVAGIVLGRKSHALLISAANLCTSILCAALFFGEGRYHVPYDPFALMLAVVGCCEIVRRVRRRWTRLRGRSSWSTTIPTSAGSRRSLSSGWEGSRSSLRPAQKRLSNSSRESCPTSFSST